MAHQIYDNFYLSNEVEDQFNSHLDMQNFCTIDRTLEGTAGMVRKINVYRATNGTEKLGMGEGNTKSIEVSYTPEEYRILLAQNKFEYFDEQAMTDPNVVPVGTRHNGCNVTVHRDYANKSCPGKYLYDRHDEIIAEVNKRLNITTQEGKVMYRVQIGAYSKKENAEKCLEKAKAAGFTDAFIATTVVEDAPAKQEPVKEPEVVFEEGDKVKMAANAPVYGKTSKFQSWVYGKTLYVRDVDGSRIVVSTQKTGAVTGAVDKKYLTKV